MKVKAPEKIYLYRYHNVGQFAEYWDEKPNLIGTGTNHEYINKDALWKFLQARKTTEQNCPDALRVINEILDFIK